jgi:hypothetical protein
MCEVHDLIPDIEAIAMSSRGHVDAIGISFPSAIDNSTMDLPLAFLLAITGPLNSVVVQWVLGHGLSDGIMPCAFHMVLELVHVNVHFFSFSVLERVIHIDGIQGLYY